MNFGKRKRLLGFQLTESYIREGAKEVFHDTWYAQKRRWDTCEHVKRYRECLKISKLEQITQDESPPNPPILDDIGNVVQFSNNRE